MCGWSLYTPINKVYNLIFHYRTFARTIIVEAFTKKNFLFYCHGCKLTEISLIKLAVRERLEAAVS